MTSYLSSWKGVGKDKIQTKVETMADHWLPDIKKERDKEDATQSHRKTFWVSRKTLTIRVHVHKSHLSQITFRYCFTKCRDTGLEDEYNGVDSTWVPRSLHLPYTHRSVSLISLSLSLSRLTSLFLVMSEVLCGIRAPNHTPTLSLTHTHTHIHPAALWMTLGYRQGSKRLSDFSKLSVQIASYSQIICSIFVSFLTLTFNFPQHTRRHTLRSDQQYYNNKVMHTFPLYLPLCDCSLVNPSPPPLSFFHFLSRQLD